MKLNRVIIAIVYALVFILFNVAVIMFAKEKAETYTISHAFTAIAFLFQIGVYLVVFRRRKNTDQTFYGVPLLIVSALYFAVQIVVSLIFIFVPADMSVIPIVVQSVLLAGYLVLALFLFIGMSIMGESEEAEESEFFLEQIENALVTVKNATDDDSVIKELDNLIAVVQGSDTISHPSMILIEKKIAIAVKQLKDDISSADTKDILHEIDNVTKLMLNRNKMCEMISEN